jgi:hypothetical protein
VANAVSAVPWRRHAGVLVATAERAYRGPDVQRGGSFRACQLTTRQLPSGCRHAVPYACCCWLPTVTICWYCGPLALRRIGVAGHDALEDGPRPGISAFAERKAQSVAPVEPRSIERDLGERELRPVVLERVGFPGVDFVPAERLAVGVGVVGIEEVPDALEAAIRRQP